jgi:SAM-dependent methyltransferase
MNREDTGLNYRKMCKFLKFRDEVDQCTRYLSQNGYVSHLLVCKNWEIAHILSDLGDGNLLDMGSTDSYILKNALRKNTKGEKYGIDLRSPNVPVEGITYLRGNLLNVPLPDEYFAYLTCLSVIEHGVDLEKFAAEVSRLLNCNGKLYVTFDYWVPKITTDLKLYGLKWNPLDKQDVLFLVAACKNRGLRLIEDIDWTLGEKIIGPGYYSPHPDIGYTFGMLVFQKDFKTSVGGN